MKYDTRVVLPVFLLRCDFAKMLEVIVSDAVGRQICKGLANSIITPSTGLFDKINIPMIHVSSISSNPNTTVRFVAGFRCFQSQGTARCCGIS